MLLAVLFGVIVCLAAVWFAFEISNKHVLRLCRSLPSVQPSYPLLGNTLLFACSLDKMEENLQRKLQEYVLKGHRAICFWIGPYPVVYVIDPDDIKKVLNNSLSRGKEMEESNSEYTKFGLLTAPVDHWKVTRRHLNLTFHPRNLEQLIPTFNNTSRQLVSDFSRHVNGDSFNLMPHAMFAAIRTILTFLYGPESLKSFTVEQLNELRHTVELCGELAALRVTRPWFHIGFIFRLLYRKEINSVKRSCHENLQIARNISIAKTKGHGSTGEQYTHNHDFQTIIDTMWELKQLHTITDQQMMDEFTSFFATGSDTIANITSSCLLSLARFPHIQDKVYEEICSVVSKNSEADITHGDLKRLPYLDQVIKETLRFFVVLPYSCREPNKDIDLGGYTLAANKTTFLFLSSVNRNPKYFPDPDKFDPDRFSSLNGSEEVFMPFSRGPRNCVGKEYALMLIKVLITHVVRKYRLSTNMDIQNLKKKFMITCWKVQLILKFHVNNRILI